MELPAVDPDKFVMREVSGLGSDRCQIVLMYDQHRFVLDVAKQDDKEDGDVLSDYFYRSETAESDGDEDLLDRCVEDLVDLVISECKYTLYSFVDSVKKPNGEHPSLEDHLYPKTSYLQLKILDGQLKAVEMNDPSEFAGQYLPTPLSAEFTPQAMTSLTPSVDIAFIQNLYANKVLKVSEDGKVRVFKSANEANEYQLEREILVLQQISEKWKLDQPIQPRVPRFLGLVTSRGRIMGMLEEFIDGTELAQIGADKASPAQCQKWKLQIEQSVSQLHENGIVWGDVKMANIMIDKADDAWLIDFGGSWTDGWIDKDLKETIEGDLQGLSKVVAILNGDLTDPTYHRKATTVEEDAKVQQNEAINEFSCSTIEGDTIIQQSAVIHKSAYLVGGNGAEVEQNVEQISE
ncbi:hypothetical protein LTR84_001931 [Exophiala bonariae]|uniref:Protein kinase domain-containing protein n=1 Tax=Exophiala bonariae TaxID=1690606 RepID=A0AAV9NC31_9EURO|nr:hypothetical protein LTR84_001931 [Exophiala bonariae]